LRERKPNQIASPGVGSAAANRERPRISIVTPSLNQGRFIGQTIDSVLSQDYPNVQYVIIDGGSTDETLEVIQRRADRIDHWVSEPDKGQTDALCKGMRRVDGQIVGWLNSDDQYYSPRVFDRVARLFETHPKVDFCYGANVYVDARSRVLFLRSQMPFHWRRLLVVWNYIHQPTVFFRRRVLDDLSFNTDLHYIMDYEFWLRAARRYRFRPVGGLVSASRWHGECKTVSDPGAFFAELNSLHAELGRPLLARFVPPRITARVLYSAQRLYSLAFLGRLLRDKPFEHIRIDGLGPLLRRQVLGVRLGGNGVGGRGRSPAGRRT